MADNTKILSLLGLCRRAGRLSVGHDAAMDSIVHKKAKLVLLTSDSSERLKNETALTIERSNTKPAMLCTAITMKEMGLAVGKNAAVLAITDENFASRLTELFGEE